MNHTDPSTPCQLPAKYLKIKDLQRITGMSKPTLYRNVIPLLTRYEFGPQSIRYREDEVHAVLESMGGAA